MVHNPGGDDCILGGGRPNIYPSQQNVVAPEVSSLLLLVSHPVVLPPRPIAWNLSPTTTNP